MDNSPINKAHYQYRRAETHLRYRRFEEAIECHQKAAEFLNESLTATTTPRALESLRLQHDFHIKQQEIIRIKRDQYENYKKAVENQRKRMAKAFPGNEFEEKIHEPESTTLQLAIYKTMEEADSLLDLLCQRTTDDLDSVDVVDTVDGTSANNNNNNNTPLGVKKPKDESTVIEELRTLNQQLHSLVYQLVTQLDASNREVDALRARVRYLESERLKQTDALAQQSNTEPSQINNLRIVTDSSGATSPFVYSPCSELSPDVVESRMLPALTPLELPPFGFTAFTKQTPKS